MLHMIVNTHNAESCAFRGKAEDDALSGAIELVMQDAAKDGVTIQGSWVNRAAHEIFFLAEAPSAHAIEDLFVRCGLIGRSHTRILPVMATEDAEATHADT